SIARGEKLVVAGDERQLPPTAFFGSAVDDSDEEADSENITLTSGFESILDALAPLISVRNLQWHYRSRDEKLIAFSNAHIYDSSLTTFPGSQQEGVLRHVHVPWVLGATGVAGSTSAEVEKVADLVIDHAENRSEESLGVIAMGIKHADRIDAAVRERLRDRADLESFFSEAQEERFFVKNLERVQGDERDAIILSVGYGKSADGRILYRFGPINTQGGERRLNVAVSRAKRRMTLVSSFSSADLDPNKLNARGAELLGAYVSFMESGGADLGSVATPPPRLNAFEQDIRDRLTKVGLKLTPQFGVSGYRIDFVASHPDKPGQFVLAIEADGASYHSSATARDRDRLRQEHLERLGWRFHRIWSTDWFRNPQAEVDRALAVFDAAVAAADRGGATGRRAQSIAPSATGQTEAVQPSRTLVKPTIWYGEPITAYSRSDLVAVVRWIQSDGLLRTEEDLIRDAMDELGWRRRGSRIDAGLREAIAAARG
ncbi:MAG: AAA domain-containing protein, partial [Nocardioidaceae bacterium]